MIIVKTSNGDMFVNEKETQIVQHDKANKMVVIRSQKDGLNCNIKDVESIIYTNEAHPTMWKDEGSELETLKKQLDDVCRLMDRYRKKENENILLENKIARLQEKLRDYGCEL